MIIIEKACRWVNKEVDISYANEGHIKDIGG